MLNFVIVHKTASLEGRPCTNRAQILLLYLAKSMYYKTN